MICTFTVQKKTFKVKNNKLKHPQTHTGSHSMMAALKDSGIAVTVLFNSGMAVNPESLSGIRDSGMAVAFNPDA